MRGGTLGIIIILILVALGGWYYYSTLSATHAPAALVPVTTGAAATAGTIPQGQGMETGTVSGTTTPENDFTVTGYNFGFTPSTLTVHKGDHVKISFVNSGGVHDFVIDEFHVATPRIETNASTTVEFDANQAGTFQYYCSVGNHRAMGMWGTLTVTP